VVNPKTNLVHFAPPTLATAHGVLSIGTVEPSSAITGGLERKQKRGSAPTRFTSKLEGALRYEIVNQGGIAPLATFSTPYKHGFAENLDTINQSGETVLKPSGEILTRTYTIGERRAS
jgi:hypothetical protein